MTIQTKHTRSQRGLTLIELMIALLISSVLMFGVGTIYVSSKRGYNIQDNLARQQENSRFSVELLVHDLRMAGYPKRYVASPIVTASTADGGGVNNSDTVTVEYLGGTDCLGQNVPANSCSADATQQCVVNRYYIAHDNPTDTDNLYCLGNGGANADIIADNVINLQVLYGIDTDTNGDGIANKYVTWPNASADPSKIVSVRFALLTQTPNEVKKAQTTKIYTLLDQNFAINNDRHFHRVYMNTVQLRNQMN